MPFYKISDQAVIVDDATFTGATSATMQAIFNLAVSNGLEVVCRPGTYDFGNTSISGAVNIRGVPGQVVFRMSTASEYLLYLGAFGEASFQGIIFDGQNAAFSTSPGLAIQALVNLQRASATINSAASFRRCVFRSSSKSGLSVNEVRLNIEDCSFVDCAAKAIGVVAGEGINIKNCRFEGQDHAVHCSPGAVSNVSIENNIIRGSRRNGIAIEPSGTIKVSRDIVIRGNIISKRNASDSWGVNYTDFSLTGAEGNGILVYLSSSVIIADNDVSDCRYSAIRTNVSSQMTITGNLCQGSFETAVYVESPGINVGEFGVTVTGNTIYGGGAGISVVNYLTYQGRLSTVTGNLIRNISVRTITYSGGSYVTSGTGVYVEGDATVTGNVIENAFVGIVLGTGASTSDLVASGNVVRNTTLGIGAASGTLKEILISGNLITGYQNGAIKAVNYDGATGAISIVGVELSPANRGSSVANTYLHMTGNVKRQPA
jgi:putative cofactor-binding repeat protein/parallel beta-helix repeat protein